MGACPSRQRLLWVWFHALTGCLYAPGLVSVGCGRAVGCGCCAACTQCSARKQGLLSSGCVDRACECVLCAECGLCPGLLCVCCMRSISCLGCCGLYLPQRPGTFTYLPSVACTRCCESVACCCIHHWAFPEGPWFLVLKQHLCTPAWACPWTGCLCQASLFVAFPSSSSS